MSDADAALLHYILFVLGCLAFIFVVRRAIEPGAIHHCDACREWWEAAQGAKIMHGRIIELDETKKEATLRLEGGTIAYCSLEMLRNLYAQSLVRHV